MARTQNKLTALQIKKLKADPQKSIKIGDGEISTFVLIRMAVAIGYLIILDHIRASVMRCHSVHILRCLWKKLENRDEYKVLIQKGY